MFLETHSWSEKQCHKLVCVERVWPRTLAVFWFHADIKFFNSMLDSNSEVLRRVLKVDLHLASSDKFCWSAQVSYASSGLQNGALFKQKLLGSLQDSFERVCW